jgi:serine phosphatase RsbU (regulator of sigma subunit)
LPNPDILKENFDDYFIFYKPKDIVSGDFYWWKKVNNHIILVTADCTGHGVPGAFMSMLGLTFLDEIVNEEVITKPNLILEELRKRVISTLKQKKKKLTSHVMVWIWLLPPLTLKPSCFNFQVRTTRYT